MPLTQENLSAGSEGHNSQAGPRTHKSSRSNPELKRNHRNGVQIMKSTDMTVKSKQHLVKGLI
ncbi:uncharacterized protein EAE98_009308 [Botrytis deweyae]|uniref:60S ribosomal protein L29 n=1 Tax=Botrytis deweyae TaxID=2478750 RepID=A0ABQ7IBW2_9HELO|nr:uncharacterized protein EAE98_009308 [Botrytis deweyae]KAF7915818.1 hypothetical protein EAE99_010069 [Botrytis elliptica]KAF7919468.1 hypothetical protein EAE98_009308 [Botrytis deweyae]